MKNALFISFLTFIAACQPQNEKSSLQENELTKLKAENSKLSQRLKKLSHQAQNKESTLAAVQGQLLKCQLKNRALSKPSNFESPMPIKPSRKTKTIKATASKDAITEIVMPKTAPSPKPKKTKPIKKIKSLTLPL